MGKSAYSIFAQVRKGDPPRDKQRSSPGPVTLSEVLLQDLRVERAHAQMLHVANDVSLHMPDAHQPILYTVLEGTLALGVPGEADVVLQPGDSALIFYGDSHVLGVGPRIRHVVMPVAGLQLDETIRHLRFGDGAMQAVVLQTLTELTYLRKNAHVSRAAPDLLVMRAAQCPGQDRDMTTISALPMVVRQLENDLEGPGALALASAFANFQLCYALKQWTSRLWGDTLHDIRCPNMRRVAMVVREIHAHPDRDWTVTRLARHVGLSRSAFAAAFHDVIGEAPISFLTRTRMERAATLLRTESLSMYEIGQRVGYPIESSFARAFKRHWGIAPRSFVGDPAEAIG
ncbi:MAG: AraC family transcriptional regulator [Novosphingobium sp.]